MINRIKAGFVLVNPVNPVHFGFSRVLALALLCAALAGCGMINWNISNSSDGCPPQSKFPCP